jgi:hypothetical protein
VRLLLDRGEISGACRASPVAARCQVSLVGGKTISVLRAVSAAVSYARGDRPQAISARGEVRGGLASSYNILYTPARPEKIVSGGHRSP